MNKRIILYIGILILILSSCSSGTVTPAPRAALTTTASPTDTPQWKLKQAAGLLSSPGNNGYSKLIDLLAEQSVIPLGQFGDYIKIKTQDAQEGYVLRPLMTDLPNDLPQMTSAEVPWMDLDMRYNFVGDGGAVTNDQIKITDINGNGTNVGNGSFSVDSAFRIRMSLRLEKNAGEYASILLMGTPPVMEGEWWRGLIRLDIGANQQNKLQLCIIDGTSEQCNYSSFVDIPTDQSFTVVFDDPQGKVMHVLDQNGQDVLEVDVTQQSSLKLPDGLFPTHTVWLGGWVNPQATLYIDSFQAEVAPSGKAYLEDIPDLDGWVDDYVHAYGDKITVDSVEMDAKSLTEAIRKNSAAFTQEKQIEDHIASFLVVNGTPLAIQNSGEPWRKITGRDLAEALQIDLAMPGLYSDIADPANREILTNANMLTLTNDLLMNVVFKNFTAEDWRRVLDNWDTIQAEFNSGTFPVDYPYYWDQADPIFLFAQEHNMKVRAQTLLCSGDCIPDSIYNGNFSKDEIKKILEFTTSVTVIRNKGKVDEWTIENEQVIADLNKVGNEKYGFWVREIGLVPATELVSRTVKKLDPERKLVVVEAFLVEDQVGSQEPEFRQAFFAYLDELQQLGVPLDGVDIENGVWVYNPPKADFEKQLLEQITARGLYLSAPETIVVLTPDRLPFWYEPVVKTANVTDPIASQAEVFSQITQTYLDVGAKAIGFGDVGDKWSWMNYSGATDANPSLFDDDARPKQAYFAVMKVLYDHLP
jgi:GH35 family endo-1,4-beta-xylanase